jgi:hypothetical protein
LIDLPRDDIDLIVAELAENSSGAVIFKGDGPITALTQKHANGRIETGSYLVPRHL